MSTSNRVGMAEKSGVDESHGANSRSPSGQCINFWPSAAKVDAKAEGLPEALESGWAQIKILLGTDDIYRGAVITVSSAWGEGHSGCDLWGWIYGAAVHHSDVRKDGEGYYFIYSLQHPVGESRWIAAQFRYQLRSGAHGVANATFAFPG
ncbi:MAG: hypothetical protein WCJ21_13375 [Planctomycetota bacterium]